MPMKTIFEELTGGLGVRIIVVDCANCSVPFGIPETLESRRRVDGKPFFCPNGHPNVFSESENQKLQKRLHLEQTAREQAEAKARDAESSAKRAWGRVNEETAKAQTARRVAAAHKGTVTKIKNRVNAGVCPCCRRNFVALGAHMRKQHPEWNPEEVKL